MERRIITTEATEEDVRIETTLRPQCLRKDQIHPENIHRSGKKQRGSLRSCIILRSPRTWKDHPFRYHCQRDGKQAESDQRAGH